MGNKQTRDKKKVSIAKKPACKKASRKEKTNYKSASRNIRFVITQNSENDIAEFPGNSADGS